MPQSAATTRSPVKRTLRHASLMLGITGLLTACSDGSDTPDLLSQDAMVAAPPALCDPLTPTYCGFPYPNDYWSVEDATTASGRRLALPVEIMPVNIAGDASQPGAFIVRAKLVLRLVALPGNFRGCHVGFRIRRP